MTDPVQTAAPDPISTTMPPVAAEPVQAPATPAVAADPATVSAGPVAQADDNKSPLDVLDQILKDAQGKAKQAVAEKNAEEAAKIEAERQRQRKLDADRVRQQLLGIAQAKESPEYKASVQQRQEEAEKKQTYDQQMDGMEIVQLEHTKI